MNIFVLDEHPVIAAQSQCNAHVVKMVLESAQMLSTAHRLLDGKMTVVNVNGRAKKEWVLPDERDGLVYKAVHTKHPCTVWTMKSRANYVWHWNHFVALCEEYTHRYGKIHMTDTKLRHVLAQPPENIPDKPMTTFALALKANPECMFPDDPVRSYREYYKTKQVKFKMNWTAREIPSWFKEITYAA
jgi:hypothetical protein